MKITHVVAPAKAGVHFQFGTQWIPAFAGMTSPGVIFRRVSMGLWPARVHENPLGILT
jgi:hypothetical protein